MRHKVFRDANHPRIVKALQSEGYGIIDLAAVGNSVPDIIVADGRIVVLMEIKMPKTAVFISQIEFLAKWQGYAGMVETGQQAVEMMKNPDTHCLQDYERQIILDICADFRATSIAMKPQIRIMEFEKQLRERLAEKGILK